jgi:ATP-dependent Lhr-like helicase
LFPPLVDPCDAETRLENWAWLLVARYGIVFRDLLTRESAAPSWGELVRVYRRMEARGELRGGRFVASVAGEQYAAPDAVEGLRKERDGATTATDWTVVAAADPLNLIGILTEAPRVAASRSLLLVIRGGRHVATRDGHEVTFHAAMTPDDERAIRQAVQLSGSLRGRIADRTSAAGG